MKHLAALPIVALVGACALESVNMIDDTQKGADLFGIYCAGCHGADASGGEVIGGRRVADLTKLSAKNAGEFPFVYVMSTIDGYARDDTHGPMPRFGELLDSELETYEGADGSLTPTPAALLRLAEYLETLQG